MEARMDAGIKELQEFVKKEVLSYYRHPGDDDEALFAFDPITQGGEGLLMEGSGIEEAGVRSDAKGGLNESKVFIVHDTYVLLKKSSAMSTIVKTEKLDLLLTLDAAMC